VTQQVPPTEEVQLDIDVRRSLDAEYSSLTAYTRFATGLRFAALGFAITLLSFLVGAYQYFLTTSDKELAEIRGVAMIAIPNRRPPNKLSSFSR